MDIQKLTERWMSLSPALPKGLREVLINQHNAIQLIAVAAAHTIPPRKDNSHMAMEFSASRKMLISDKIPSDKPVRLGLNIKDFTIYILSSRLEVLQMGDLNGHTTTEGFNFFKKHLGDYGVDISNLDLKLSYDLPDGPLGKEHDFAVEYPDAAEETVKYRANAKFLLQFFNRVFKNTSEILVWPQNFCTSSLIFTKNPDPAGNVTNTVEYGFSPQNSFVDEPHFYVRINAGENTDASSQEFEMNGEGKRYKGDGDFVGVYLRVSDIWKYEETEKQFLISSEFFADAIEKSLKIASPE